MEYRNATRTARTGVVDCEINHPTFGWILYTLDPSDTDQTIDNVELITAMQANNDVAEYVAPAPEPVPYAPSDLSPRRFGYLLAYTGLDDVWAALEAELKDTDRASYAQIKAQRSALSFSQEKTLGLVAMFADTAKRVAPNADLSGEAIKAAWIVAEQVNL
jgi:hypothetical protein